jgi:hypothetical protein
MGSTGSEGLPWVAILRIWRLLGYHHEVFREPQVFAHPESLNLTSWTPRFRRFFRKEKFAPGWSASHLAPGSRVTCPYRHVSETNRPLRWVQKRNRVKVKICHDLPKGISLKRGSYWIIPASEPQTQSLKNKGIQFTCQKAMSFRWIWGDKRW